MSGASSPTPAERHAAYWDDLADTYQRETSISVEDVHYGPLIPGERELGLLPPSVKGFRCLELGCGAGQNSIALAKQGARCVALDISAAQLAHGKSLAARERVDIEFRKGDLDALPNFGTEGFDLVHSAYGLPFASNPERVIQWCAANLRPDGLLVFSMGHPVYAGEWLEVDGEEGVFLHDYFHPTPDAREGETSDALSRAFPVSEPAEWIRRAHLRLERVLEPAALPPHRLREAPYRSESWEEQAPELTRVPIVAIYAAVLRRAPS